MLRCHKMRIIRLALNEELRGTSYMAREDLVRAWAREYSLDQFEASLAAGFTSPVDNPVVGTVSPATLAALGL